MTILFEGNGNKFIIDYLYCVEKYHTMEIIVESNNFMGKYNFCIPSNELRKTMKQLKTYDEKQFLYIKLADYDSDAYIEMKINSLIDISIAGQIGATYDDWSMKFKFQVDQTILKLLESFINECFALE